MRWKWSMSLWRLLPSVFVPNDLDGGGAIGKTKSWNRKGLGLDVRADGTHRRSAGGCQAGGSTGSASNPTGGNGRPNVAPTQWNAESCSRMVAPTIGRDAVRGRSRG